MKKRILLLTVSLLLLSAVTLCPAAFTLTRATVHLSPSVALVKSGIAGEPICFSLADFRQALCVTEIDALTVTALPYARAGVLTLDGARVQTGRTLSAAELERLRFTPADALVESAEFSVTCGGYAGGEVIPCTLYFHTRINYAPTVGEASFTVAATKDGELRGALGGADPEGDALTYLVVAYPKKGRLEITDAARGDFVYRPKDGYTGKDVFSYVVRDACGNYSEVATVRITVTGAAKK
jgi:hypothetical protein